MSDSAPPFPRSSGISVLPATPCRSSPRARKSLHQRRDRPRQISASAYRAASRHRGFGPRHYPSLVLLRAMTSCSCNGFVVIVALLGRRWRILGSHARWARARAYLSRDSEIEPSLPWLSDGRDVPTKGLWISCGFPADGTSDQARVKSHKMMES